MRCSGDSRFGAERLNGKVAYLATVRKDGSPRVHPMTPIIGQGHLFVFMEPTSPKGHDLQRDGRYAILELRALAVRLASYTPA